MKIYKIITKIIKLFLMGLMLQSCVLEFKSNSNDFTMLDYNKNVIKKNIYISNQFSFEETMLISVAIKEWEETTFNFIKFNILEEVDPIKYQSLPNKKDSILFLRVRSDNSYVQHLDTTMTNNNIIIGFYTNEDIIPIIGIVYDRLLGKSHYKSLILHELGHSLGLQHSSNINSVMYPLLDRCTDTLSNEDINDFCKINNCIIKVKR